MADTTVVSDDQPPLPTTDYELGLSVPPLDTAFFSLHFHDDNGGQGDNQADVLIDDLDFDFSFDDLYLPSAEELDDLLNPSQILECDTQPGQDANFSQLGSSLDQFPAVFKSTSSELRHISGEGDFSGDRSSNGSRLLNSVSSGWESHQISGNLNVPSPESNGSNRRISDNCGGDEKLLNCSSPESRGSGNCGSNVSEDSNNGVNRSVSSSRNLNNSANRTGVVNEKFKLDEPSKNNVNSSLLKRKKDCEDMPNNTAESRISKFRKSSSNSENNNNDDNGGLSEEEEKRKARLMRNRESAQLSRQRKKHYVEELEDKVKMMQSTIQDLNAKISYFMAENAALRQQMGGSAAVPPPAMAPPPPGMYSHPAMMYPWMPYAPPFMMKPQGSQVPLVPIPRLKQQQQPAQAPKVTKKVESKKNEEPKTKKVASVSFLGLLFFFFLFGCLVPMINMRYGGVRETLTGGESYVGGEFYEKHHGRVLLVNGTDYGKNYGDRRGFSSKSGVHCGQRDHDSGGKPNDDELVRSSNGSEPLVASLYVPRNDKLVKIDGNLIIHSVLASEKTMSSHGKRRDETGLAVPRDLGPYIPVPGVQRNDARHPHPRAIGSGTADKDSRKPKATDGRLQQWFREGLAGPMLTSGMCTEVFQFDALPASASGAIVSATTRNISEEQNQNSTHISKGRNRRILRSLPVRLPESSHNISTQDTRRNPQKGNLNGNNSSAPMVVSVLVDPREAGDADVDGVMGRKSFSQIFVVVLIDSVKYVTYSCMLPFKGSAPHLVTT